MRFPEAREGSREKSLDISADWGRLPQQPEGLVFALPVSVQVAVSPGGYLAGIGHEDGLGLVSGLQETGQALVAGDEFDPLDVVFFFHGMGDRAHGDFISAIDLGDDGNMLLKSTISGAFFHELHGLAAAGRNALPGLIDFNNVAATVAFVDF